MGDFSRDPDQVLQDAINNGYYRVRFQQGKALLDRELNLLGDLASPQRFARANFGNGVRGEGSDFMIGGLNVAGNDFTISRGTCLVDGFEVATDNTSYRAQPHRQNPPPLPAGVSNVYLRVVRTETTGANDAGLLNPLDVRAETSIRDKVDWEVLVTPKVINARDHFLLASINTASSRVIDLRRKGLNVSVIRDELTNARGDATQLSDRLNVSLTAAGTLKPNTVGNTQISDNAITGPKLVDNSVTNTRLADNAVTAQKLADNSVSEQKIADHAVSTDKIAPNAVTRNQLADNSVNGNKISNGGVIANKLAGGAVTEPALANNAVSNRTIANGVVTMEKMNATQVAGVQVTLAAAPVGGRTEQIVNLQETDGHAFFFISVHFDDPRPDGMTPVSRFIDWHHRVTLQKVSASGKFRHFHQIVIENTNQVEIKATIRALRLAES